MADYQSLYRKYRPQRFDALIGQDHVTSALRNAVREGRTGHAYLFSGPRGTGKTTTARILAKAMNCTDVGTDGEPCGACDNCVSIARGTFFDIRELDAASNRGIDNIREVIDSTALGLAPGSRAKLYVLDEVHMLTEPASNALLKTLEEAPPHVVFVLATTNPEKVLPTIRSRTQHYEFRLVATDLVAAHLAEICALEEITAEPGALEALAAASGGFVRDALSMLDQAISHGTGTVEAAAVAGLHGGSAFALRIDALEAIAAEDAPGALVALNQLLETGHEPRRVAEDVLTAARDAFVLTAGAGRVRIVAPEEMKERLIAVGERLGNAALVRVIETLGQAVTDMRGTDAADPRLVVEVALVRLSRREAGPPLQTVMERIERLERSMGAGGVRTPVAPATSPAAPRAGAAAVPSTPTGPLAQPSTVPASSDAPARSPRRTIGAVRQAGSATRDVPVEAPPAPPAFEEALDDAAPSDAGSDAAPEVPTAATTDSAPAPASTPEPVPGSNAPLDIDDVILAWGAILPSLPVATRSAVQGAQPLRVDDDVLVFGAPPGILEAARPRFKKEADAIRAALAQRLGRSVKFSLVAAPEFSLGSSDRPAGPGPGGPAPSSDGPPESEPPEPDEVVDMSEVTDAGGEHESIGLGLLREQLGATVVGELTRDQ